MHMKRNTMAMALPAALLAGSLPTVVAAQSPRAVYLHVSMGFGRHSGASGGPPAGAAQGYLGIGFRDVGDDRLTALKLKEPHGVEVIHVDHDGPASQAGVREHDVILQLNGQAIESEEQLRRILHETPVGRMVAMVISRDGQQINVSTQMADRAAVERQAWQQRYTIVDPPPSFAAHGNGFLGGEPVMNPAVTSPPITAPPDPRSHGFMESIILGSSYTGATVELVGPQLAQFFGSQGGNGLLVRSVEPSSPAAAAGLRAGDVVVRANAIILASLADWARLVHENKGRQISVVIVRDKQEQTLVLIPDAKKRSSAEHEALPERHPEAEHAQAIASSFGQMN
jgi:predicted metalloprotease with PDZ domain